MSQYNSPTLGLFFTFCYAIRSGIHFLANPRGEGKHTLYTTYATCALLGIWSLGIVLARVAGSYEETLFWQRVSGVGWAPISSVLLHRTLSLYGSRLLKRWWSYLLGYFPVFLGLVVFSVSRSLAENTQHFVRTATG